MKRFAAFILLAAVATSAFSQQSSRYAVVNLSANYLREEPSYTAELGTQALMGSIVTILDKDNYWYKVRTDEPYTAWCTELGLVKMSAVEIEQYKAAPKYICIAWHSTLYSDPSSDSPKICDIVEGDILRVVYDTAGKNRPAETRGFAKAMLPDGAIGYLPKRDVALYSEWLSTREPTGENIIAEAMKFIGTPYLWGGTSPNGVDCSGLVRHVFMMNGISLPRNASQQARMGHSINPTKGKSLIDSLQTGDLLFFGFYKEDNRPKITHVGIYISDGQFIHSSQYVRISTFANYSSKELLFARRIL